MSTLRRTPPDKPKRRVVAARGRPERRQFSKAEITALCRALGELEAEAADKARLPHRRPVRPQLWRDLRLLVRLGAVTGLRVNELLSRRVEHVIREGSITRLEILRSKKRGKAAIEHMWVDSGLGGDLAAHAAALESEGGTEAFIFATSSGKPYDQGNLSRSIRIALDRAGIDIGERPTFHALRHHAAVRAFDETKDINRVRALLGHESIAQTAAYLGLGIREQERLNRETMQGLHY